MSAPIFLDTNILTRYFTGANDPHPHNQAMAEPAQRLIERIEAGEEKVVTTGYVIFETVFLLERRYKVPKSRIRQMLGDLLFLSSVQINDKRLLLQALDTYAEMNLSFVDSYTARFMQANEITAIYSWDTDFDRVPNIQRIEPNS